MRFEHATISRIAQAIIKFFKKLKNRKKEGKKLTGPEAIAVGSSVVEPAKVAMAAEKDLKNENKSMMTGMTTPIERGSEESDGLKKMLPMILAGVAVLFFLKK